LKRGIGGKLTKMEDETLRPATLRNNKGMKKVSKVDQEKREDREKPEERNGKKDGR